MTEPGHESKAYPLSGPESVTQRGQVECVSEAIGRKVVLEETTAEEYRDALGRWGDAEVVDSLVRRAPPSRPARLRGDLWNGNVLYRADATSG